MEIVTIKGFRRLVEKESKSKVVSIRVGEIAIGRI